MPLTAISRTLALLAASAAVLPAAAFGGGLGDPVPETVVVMPTVAATRFDGFYVGGSLGFARGEGDDVGIRSPLGGDETDVGTLDIEGALVGAYVGYRMQNDSPWVLGAEFGITGGSPSGEFDTATGSGSVDLTFAASLRGSVGYAVGARGLAYGFAGLNYGQFDYEVTGLGADIDDDFSATGYVAGFGYERAISDRLSLRGEYQFSDFGRTDIDDAAGFSTTATPTYQSLSIGASFRF